MRIRIIITSLFISTCLVVVLFALAASAYAAGPTAQDDNFTTDEDTTIEGNVLADNGNGPDEGSRKETLTVIQVNGTSQVGQEINLEPSHALLTIYQSGTFIYKPAGQFEHLAQGQSDTDTFTYTISDSKNKTDTATVTITVNGVNYAPVLEGLSNSITIHENDGPTIIDSDVTLLDPAGVGFDGGKLTATYDAAGEILLNADPLNPFSLDGAEIFYEGTKVGEITGSSEISAELTFFPAATCQIVEELIENLTYANTSDDPESSHTLTIAITNGQGSSTGEHIITINIIPENDPPVAESDTYEVIKGGALIVSATDGVLANDSDPENALLTAELVDVPDHDPAFILSVSGGFTYHHDNSDTTEDTFTYRASDGELDNGTPTTVTLNIISPPVITSSVSSQIEKNSAKLGATVESDGGSAITATGIVWADTPNNPGSFSYSGTVTASSAQIGSFTVYLGGLSSDTVYYYRGYARNNAGISYTEESQFRTIKGYDYGDAPSDYPKAWHKVTSGGLYLGYKVDVEADHQPDSDAMGDDSHGDDDEDGITFHSDTLTPGSVFGGVLTASDAGYMNAWIDFNRDGDWDDEYEHVMDNEAITSTNVTFSWPVYTIGKGKTYARFRFSSQTGLGPGGAASDGEVEDYCLTLEGTDPVDDGDDNGDNDVISNVTITSTVNEGSTATLSGNVSCAGTLIIGWGDDSDLETITLDAGYFSETHEYADGPIDDCSIQIQFIDCDNVNHMKSKTIQVKNVRPTIDVSGPASVNAGSPCTITMGNVVDPGSDTVSRYIVDWGDGSSDQYEDTGDKSHTYTTAGNYTISIELKDEDGNHPGAGIRTLTVNDPGGANGTSSDDDDEEGDVVNGDGDNDDGNGSDNNTGNTGGSKRVSGGSSRIGGSSDLPSISGYSSEDDFEPGEDSGGGGVPLWLILVPIFGVLVVGIGLYYYLGNAFEWW